MRRRGFVQFLGSMAVGAPLSAIAQLPPRPLIGFLSARSPEDNVDLLVAFRQGLGEGGFIEGKNVSIDYRWAGGQYDRLPALAADLAQRTPGVIVASGGEEAALAAKEASQKIPIVFAASGDPIKLGLVASYNRPGGNLTGINLLTTTLEAKRLDLLHEFVPKAAAVGMLVDSNFLQGANQLREAEKAARSIGVNFHALRAGTDQEIDVAFKTIARRNIHALLVAASPFFDTRRKKLVTMAERYAVPTMYQFREYVVAGGLLSYGIDLLDAYRHVGIYTAKILKGAKPAELPILQVDKFALVVNLKTAKKLGLSTSRDFFAHVDEVIE